MNTEAYGLITTILLWGALVALIGAGGFLVAVASKWRSAKRNRRVIWCAGLVAAAFAMVGTDPRKCASIDRDRCTKENFFSAFPSFYFQRLLPCSNLSERSTSPFSSLFFGWTAA